MSIFLERDFSNGDIPFGMGVSDSDDDDDDDWIGGRELIQGDAKALTIWCLESRRTTHSQVVVNISYGKALARDKLQFFWRGTSERESNDNNRLLRRLWQGGGCQSQSM